MLDFLENRHAEFFSTNWDELSADDAKRFAQIERDIIEVRAAFENPNSSQMPEFDALLHRLEAKMSALEGLSDPRHSVSCARAIRPALFG